MPATARQIEPSPTPSSVEVGILPPFDLIERWGEIATLLAKVQGRSHGEYELCDYFERLADGRQYLWVAEWDDRIRACLVCEICEYPRYRSLLIFALGGENPGFWFDHLPRLEEWARSMGCKAVEPIGRLGWEKLLKPHGYEKSAVVMRKEL